ncbi:MAG: PorT family protein [Bacteroidales bacterium]|nr:PorT family protein [Bacteroidales bacterium]
MKKLLATTLTLFLTASLTAQISFGPRAGFNLTNLHESHGSISINGDFKPGFQLGVVANIPVLGDLLSIQPGLLFAQQGAKFNNFLGTGADATFNLNYLQMPINAQFGFDVGQNARILLQAGPYLGFALGGTIKAEFQGRTQTTDINFGSGDMDTRRFDFGVGFGAGVEFGRFQVGIGYNLGIANLSNADNVTTRNSGLALTVTYLFSGRR